MVKAVMPGMPARGPARSEAQRQRILDAAQQCFIEYGFHAAGMAAIAETAGMSQGLIYRYFKGKNEIIVAIIERQLKLLREEIAVLDHSVDLAARLADAYGVCAAGQKPGLSPALVLEMSAAATRDSGIASALEAFDTAVRDDIIEWLHRRDKAVGRRRVKNRLAGRALMLQCLIDGLKIRQTREPRLDRKLLRSALAEILSTLLQDGTQESSRPR